MIGLTVKSAAVFAALVLTALPASAQQTTVQTGAGMLDKSGWTDASSKEGAYSVQLPCLYDEQVQIAAPESLAKRSFNLECSEPDGTLFRVMRVEFSTGSTGAQAFFVRLQSFEGNRVLRTFKLGGADATDMKNEAPNHCAWTRQVRAGGDNLILVVEHDGKRCESLQPEVTKFFDSLVVRPR